MFATMLDEIDEEHLWDGIHRREALRKRGLCDYCERKPSTRPCKFPERHRAALKSQKKVKAAR